MFAGLPLNMIIAVDKKARGIGYQNKLPWHCSDDLKFFKEKTMGALCIVGYKTAKDLPPLKGRVVSPISRDGRHTSMTIEELESEIGFANAFNNETTTIPLFLIGGAEVYKYFLSKGLVDKVYLSEIEFKNKEYEYDTFFDYPFDEFEKRKFRNVFTDDYNLAIFELIRK